MKISKTTMRLMSAITIETQTFVPVTMKTSEDQGDLFGYVKPDGSPALHPPLCNCAQCGVPVERFHPQPAASIGESVPEEWESDLERARR